MPWAVATTAVHETNGGSDSHVVHQHEKRPADLYTQTFDRLSSREQGPDGGPTARVPFGRATTHAHAGPSGTGMHGLAPDDTPNRAACGRIAGDARGAVGRATAGARMGRTTAGCPAPPGPGASAVSVCAATGARGRCGALASSGDQSGVPARVVHLRAGTSWGRRSMPVSCDREVHKQAGVKRLSFAREA
ncbi:hypothetical protein AcV7_009068 [Taiwanofungus camphoratus]|nr:hypothetical protein AcV7_009068 [Antrodia cinnamomea]